MVLPLLKRYVLALQRYKWAGLAGFLGVLGASSIVAIQPPPEDQFQSIGTLGQNAPEVTFSATGVELQQRGQVIFSEATLFDDRLLTPVSESLKQQGFNIEPDQIRQNTTVETGDAEEGGTQQVAISYTAENAEEPKAVLTVLFEAVEEYSGFINRQGLTRIVEALNARLPDIEGELRQAEQALEAYDRNELPAIQAASDGSLLGAISGNENQFRQNQITLVGILAQMDSIERQLGLNTDEAYVSSALSSDPIVAQLRASVYQAETQKQQLLSTGLREAHPTVQEIDNNLQSFRQRLALREREVVTGGGALRALPGTENAVRRLNSNLDPARAALANQLVELRTQRDALVQQQQLLAQSVVQLREQYKQSPNKQLQRDRLAQEVALKKAFYDQLQAKLIDAQAAEAETVSSVTITSAPSDAFLIPVEANNPVVVLLIGSVLGIVTGGAIVYLLDMLDSTIRTYEDLDKLFEEQDVPLLGLVPEISYRGDRPALALITDPDHSCNDIYERLRTNLQLSGVQLSEGNVPQTVLITSTRDQEGKTTTAFNLGIASARAGRRTLIVEMDFRTSSQAKRLGIKPNEQAVLEPLRYYSGYLSDPVQMVPAVENLYISPSVGPQRNPAAVLDSDEMSRFFKDVKARFDFVILDVPNLTSSNDAMLLEPKCDGMVIVSRPDFTEKPLLTTALEQIEENEDLRILGAVINSAKIPIAEAQRKEEEFATRNELEDEEEEITAKNIPAFTSIDF